MCLVFKVWVSSVTQITAEDLKVQDKDTPPEDLHFMVTPPSNGHLALKSAPMKPVLNFTQAHIDQGQLLFVHNGEKTFSHLLLYIYISLEHKHKYGHRNVTRCCGHKLRTTSLLTLCNDRRHNV